MLTKVPPATSAGGCGPAPSGSQVVSAVTVAAPATPAPSCCHAAPSQRAIRFTTTPAAVVKSPPAINWGGHGPAPSGCHDVNADTTLFIPVLSGCHDPLGASQRMM